MKNKRAGQSGARRERMGGKQHGARPFPSRVDRRANDNGGAVNARQRYQHYMALAEAAEKSGDKVTSESYYQFADHYYRLLQGSEQDGRRL